MCSACLWFIVGMLHSSTFRFLTVFCVFSLFALKVCVVWSLVVVKLYTWCLHFADWFWRSVACSSVRLGASKCFSNMCSLIDCPSFFAVNFIFAFESEVVLAPYLLLLIASHENSSRFYFLSLCQFEKANWVTYFAFTELVVLCFLCINA